MLNILNKVYQEQTLPIYEFDLVDIFDIDREQVSFYKKVEKVNEAEVFDSAFLHLLPNTSTTIRPQYVHITCVTLLSDSTTVGITIENHRLPLVKHKTIMYPSVLIAVIDCYETSADIRLSYISSVEDKGEVE